MTLASKLADYQQYTLDELNELHLELLEAIRNLDTIRKSSNITGEQMMNIVSRICDVNEMVKETCEEVTELLRELDDNKVTRSDRAEEREIEEEDFRAMIKIFGPYLALFTTLRTQQRQNNENDDSDDEN